MTHRAWRRFAVPALAAPFLLAACASAALQPPIAPFQDSQFEIFEGDSLIATEHIVRFDDRVEGEIELIGRARAEYVAYLGDSADVKRIETQVRPWQGTSFGNSVAVDFAGDSMFIQHLLPIPSNERKAGGPVMPYVHPSPALLEMAIWRAMRVGGDPPEVTLWFPLRGVTMPIRVSRVSGRIADVEMAGGRIRVWFDQFGMLLAEVPALGWSIRRR